MNKVPKSRPTGHDGERMRGAQDEQARIVLGLLESVGRDGAQSQRRLAAELGIALGLVNAYLKRCVNKGLVKVRHVPARRYAYYLTPKGFAEKSRLTVQYLTSSLGFFRQAKTDCIDLFESARTRGISRVVLSGCSDLAEIAVICAIECEIEIVAIVDATADAKTFVGVPVESSYDAVTQKFDAVVITHLADAEQFWASARDRFGADRILTPRFLRLAVRQEADVE
jgi:DNA-binding MarR family transcriptional regulator